MARGPYVQFCRQTPQLQDHGIGIERFRTLRPGIGRHRDQSERKRYRHKRLFLTEIKLHTMLIPIRFKYALERWGIESQDL
jgi:hypothetical protein